VAKGIPEYSVLKDVYAQGYIQQIKKYGNYNKYYKEAAMRPGGLRSVKQNNVVGPPATTSY